MHAYFGLWYSVLAVMLRAPFLLQPLIYPENSPALPARAGSYKYRIYC